MRSILFLLVCFTTMIPTAHAHPGDGMVVDAQGNIYFSAVSPFVGGPNHHGTVWKLVKGRGEPRIVYRSKYKVSSVITSLGLDGKIYLQERHYLGEVNGTDAFITEVHRLDDDKLVG